MFQENEKEWILEAINHLKHRKARPDLSRISLRMKRKYLMSFAQTKKLLESLIESGIVVKAVYKNNTSYRDVSKWKKGRLGGQILNSNRMLQRFIRAIEATEKTKGTGVSAKCIEDYLASQSEEKCFLSGAALKNALEKEISNGFLKKRVHGPVLHYYVNPKNLENLHQLVSMEDEEIEDQSQCESAECQNEGNSPDKDITNNRSRSIRLNEHSQSSAEIGLLLSSVLNAISETEQSENVGSSLLDIKEILVMKGIRFADDIFLTEFLENAVKKGLLVKNDQGPVAFYAENKNSTNEYKLCDASIVENPESEYENNTSLTKCVKGAQELDLTNSSKQLQGTWSGEYLQLNLNSAIPLRPPSKRKVGLCLEFRVV